MLTCLLNGCTAVSRAPRSGFDPNPGVWPSRLDSPAPAVTTAPSHPSASTSSKPTAISSQSSAHCLNRPLFIFPIEPRLRGRTCDPPASPASSPAFPPFLTRAVLSSSGASTSTCFPSLDTRSRPQTPLSSPSSLSSNVTCSGKFSQSQGLHLRGEICIPRAPWASWLPVCIVENCHYRLTRLALPPDCQFLENRY